MRTPMLPLAVAAVLVACGDNLTEPTANPVEEGLLPFASAVANSGTPALVFNFGEGKDSPNCTFGTFGTSNNGTFVRAPNGQGIATCRIWGLDPIPTTERLTGFRCFLSLGGLVFTNQSLGVRTPSGMLTVTCIFDK